MIVVLNNSKINRIRTHKEFLKIINCTKKSIIRIKNRTREQTYKKPTIKFQ